MANIKPVLYYAPTSFYSQKALLALEEKGVEYERRLVKLHELENYAPWFMKLNAQGQVPLLQHGDTFIADSKAITDYIDNNFAGPQLFPVPAVQEVVTLIDSLPIPVLTYGTSLTPDLVTDSQVPPHVIEHMTNTLKTNKMGATLERYKTECLDDPELQAAYSAKLSRGSPFGAAGAGGDPRTPVLAAIEQADGVFTEINNILEQVSKGGCDKTWLVCEAFTAADMALGVALQRLHWVGLSQRLWGTRPLVDKYRQRLLVEKPAYVNICVKVG